MQRRLCVWSSSFSKGIPKHRKIRYTDMPNFDTYHHWCKSYQANGKRVFRELLSLSQMSSGSNCRSFGPLQSLLRSRKYFFRLQLRGAVKPKYRTAPGGNLITAPRLPLRNPGCYPKGGIIFDFCIEVIQHCFICRCRIPLCRRTQNCCDTGIESQMSFPLG
jgi:hypothetical protein